MKTQSARSARLACLFLLGCLLFNYPLITLFDRPVLVMGVPLLYAYLFGAWALIIVLVAVVVERRD